MPNLCTATINVRGYDTSVDEFIERLKANYDYNKKEFSEHKHFFRIFDVCVYEEDYEKVHGVANTIIKRAVIDIECAWSVNVCMFPGELTYYDDFMDYDNPKYLSKDKLSEETLKTFEERRELAKIHATNILETAKELCLDIEIVSVEPGMAFTEHYFVNREGVCEVETCDDYNEYYIEDCETYEDFKHSYNNVPEATKEVTEDIFRSLKNQGENTYTPNDPFYNTEWRIDNLPDSRIEDMCKVVYKDMCKLVS
jgi:hypothetical protein